MASPTYECYEAEGKEGETHFVILITTKIAGRVEKFETEWFFFKGVLPPELQGVNFLVLDSSKKIHDPSKKLKLKVRLCIPCNSPNIRVITVVHSK